jgi:hypothetical protein
LGKFFPDDNSTKTNTRQQTEKVEQFLTLMFLEEVMCMLSIFNWNAVSDAKSRTYCNRTMRTTYRLLACVAGLIFTMTVDAHAQSTLDVKTSAFVFAQSKDVELPEDFLVRVEGNKLQVALESLGVIDAKRPTANLLVRLLDSSGAEKTATTNSQGIAEFTGVKPDELHAVVVADKNSHGVIPLMTVSESVAQAKGIVSTRLRLPIMETNQEEILASIGRDIAPSGVAGSSFYTLDDYNLQGLNLYRVRLQTDGNLLGRIIIADRELAENLRYAKLTFFRGNQVVARTDSLPSDGSFEVSGLETGIHGVVAAGPAGYSAFAFDVLPPSIAPGQPEESLPGLPVSFAESKPSEKLFVFLVPPKLVNKVLARVREGMNTTTDSGATQSFAGQPGMPGGFGGGGFGGGGFGGGGSSGGGGIGGGGGLSGLAGLAGIAAIIANDSGSNNNLISPIVVVSP